MILLFEDLHWGDASLLEFVERLVDWSTGLPILVICSARPELYDLRAGWGGGKRNSSTVSLSPLAAEDTARLVSALLDSTVLPADTQSALLERSGGNPLYAEEYVRLYLDRGSTEDLPLPDSVHGIIAARLDSLPAERKSLLHDASVVGKVFWAGALEIMSAQSADTVRNNLHSLVQRELVRPMRISSVEGQAEYAFWHALVRDVAYGQIPRASRAERHRAAADWIEAMAGERLADHADLVAHHLTEAIALTEAAGGDVDDELIDRAARVLVLAGDRAANLDQQRAEQLYRRALELTPPDSVGRGRVLVKAGDVAYNAGHPEQARADLEEAAARLEAAGEVLEAGRAFSLLGRVYFGLGGADRMEAATTHAVELLESQPPGPDLVDAYGRMAVLVFFQGRSPEQALVWSDKAIELAGTLDLRGREVLNALSWRGFARFELGDLDGIADLELALADALELAPVRAVPCYVNLADVVWRQRGPAAALELLGEATSLAERPGSASGWPRAESCWMLYDLGEWDELVSEADDIRQRTEEQGRTQAYWIASTYLALVLVRRGRIEDAAAVMDETLPRAREVHDPQVLAPALAVAALLAATRGDTPAARGLVEEWEAAIRNRLFFRAQNVTDTVRIACELGDPVWAERLREGVVTAAERDRLSALTAEAAIAWSRGESAAALPAYVDAARGWHDFGCVLEHGLALLGAARCQLALDRADEAVPVLREAGDVFAHLGALPLLGETEALLGAQRRATAG